MFLNQAFAIIKIGKSYDEKVSLKACAEHSRSRLVFQLSFLLWHVIFIPFCFGQYFLIQLVVFYLLVRAVL